MKKRVGKILFWLCIVVCVLGLAYIAIYYFRKDKNEDVYQKVQKQVEEKKQEEDAEDEIPIDFASFRIRMLIIRLFKVRTMIRIT